VDVSGAANLIVRGVRLPLWGEKGLERGSIAVVGGRVARLGEDRDVMDLRRPETKVIEMDGGTLLPGFLETHAHLGWLGETLVQIEMRGCRSASEAAGKCRDVPLPPSGWLIANGWDQTLFEGQQFPHARELDAVCGRVPVICYRVDGHAAWVSSAALALARIDDKTPDPAGGRILRDEAGRATGVLIDHAMELVRRLIPEPSVGERKSHAKAVMKLCLAHGITGFTDAGTDEAMAAAVDELAAHGEIPIRLDLMPLGMRREFVAARLRQGPLFWSRGGRVAMRLVKYFLDGALGSRGAALSEAYADEPSQRGLLLMSRDDWFGAAEEAVRAGFGVAVHAIGDASVTLALDGFEHVERQMGHHGRMLRVEHAQLASDVDLDRMARLGVIPAMQPIHCAEDRAWVERRLGAGRASLAFRWRSIRERGMFPAFGSDAAVSPLNPLLGIVAAETRALPGETGWTMSEALTRREAIEGYTSWAARAMGGHGLFGALEEGESADFVVWDRDLLSVETGELVKAKPQAVFIEGLWIHG
jgi:predicted amidohydrolase YtcJ